jgi:hypothetical protein
VADMLATPSDLASLLQRDVDTATATLLIEVGTAKVQRAAGGQRIVAATSTAVIDIMELDEWLDLPQYPVRSVDLVVLDGVTLAASEYQLVRQRLWRAVGWIQSWSRPSQALVTSSHGLLAGSQALQLGRDMVLSLARTAYPNPSGATSAAIDDYRVTYAEADARMQLSPYQEAAIAAEYGASAYVTCSA